MSSSLRLLLSLVVLLSLALSFVAADPPTSCSPITVDTFTVTAGTGGTPDTEATLIAVVNGTYPIQTYTAVLSQNYKNNAVFFNVFLTPNSTINTTGTIGVTFTISLNGLTKNQNGTTSPQIFAPNSTTGLSTIEFTNWVVSSGNSTDVLMINVTEIITVGQDLTQCFYVYTITFFNPAIGSGTGLNNVSVVGDPQFIGLRGQSFQVHGVDGAIYNLISDKSMQLNSRFTFLGGPRPCPVMPSTGKVSHACWSHPGSYLSELALKTVGGSQLLIVSGDAASGFASVTIDGKALTEGSSEALDFGKTGLIGSISVDNSHELSVQAGHFNLLIENIDGFVNLRQVAVPPSSWGKLASHGLLGQTWQNKRYGGKIKEIEGDVDDYLIEDDNIFGDAFIYNRFTQ